MILFRVKRRPDEETESLIYRGVILKLIPLSQFSPKTVLISEKTIILLLNIHSTILVVFPAIVFSLYSICGTLPTYQLSTVLTLFIQISEQCKSYVKLNAFSLSIDDYTTVLMIVFLR